MAKRKMPLTKPNIANQIISARNCNVILDRHLAQLYGVETRVLNQAVRRNIERFPDDFMFALTRDEIMRISQTVTSLKYSKSVNVFTEHGALMAASVLNTPQAVEMGIFVIRAFVKLREMIPAHREMVRKLAEIERRVAKHDTEIGALIQAVRQLMTPPVKSQRRIGFTINGKRG